MREKVFEQQAANIKVQLFYRILLFNYLSILFHRILFCKWHTDLFLRFNEKVDEVLKKCNALTSAIGTILATDQEDSNEEFVETIRAVENILDQILKNQGMPLSKMDLVRLQYYLEDFHNKLIKMVTVLNTLLRSITSLIGFVILLPSKQTED